MSPAQEKYANYLLRQLGFFEEETRNKYLQELLWKTMRWVQVERRSRSRRGNIKIYHEWVRKSVGWIEILKAEVELRKSVGTMKLKQHISNSAVTATDLASFTFCPVAYSISKSIETDRSPVEFERVVGTNLHEMRLLTRDGTSSEYQTHKSKPSYLIDDTYLKIRQSSLKFSGHSGEQAYFYSKADNYVGQPDYIYQDENGEYFAVEEKFKYFNQYPNDFSSNDADEKLEPKARFRSSHIVQLKSYVNLIVHYKLSYGILIYWYYSMHGDKPHVHSMRSKTIRSVPKDSQLEFAKSGVEGFRQNGRMHMDHKLNARKCVRCGVSMYCGHKGNSKPTIRLPYPLTDVRLERVKY